MEGLWLHAAFTCICSTCRILHSIMWRHVLAALRNEDDIRIATETVVVKASWDTLFSYVERLRVVVLGKQRAIGLNITYRVVCILNPSRTESRARENWVCNTQQFVNSGSKVLKHDLVSIDLVWWMFQSAWVMLHNHCTGRYVVWKLPNEFGNL